MRPFSTLMVSPVRYSRSPCALSITQAIAERSLGPRPEVTMPHVVLATELASAHTFTNPPSLKVRGKGMLCMT